MKHIATMTLMLSLGVASVYAQQINMTFSGTSAASTVDLKQPNTSNDEDNFAGGGSLGRFTFRLVRAIDSAPTPSSSCSGPSKVHFNDPAGAGVFRFEDGSLLFVHIVPGGDEGDCIDFAAQQAHCTLTLKITGGSGRFKSASGMLTFSETAQPVLADAMNNPVYFVATGGFTGVISGVGREEDSPREPQ
jgi:hypothetical protein